ncbi:MAG: hypothetical protein WA951_06505 [Leeuwenhoekiella sp.]
MKTKTTLKVLSILMILCFNFHLKAQVPTQKQDSIINTLTENYTQKLVLTGKQEVIFKEKLQSYYLEKETLRKEMRGENKLKALYDLGKQEDGAMRNVLTQEQFDLYLRIKPSLQPLEEISLKKKN